MSDSSPNKVLVCIIIILGMTILFTKERKPNQIWRKYIFIGTLKSLHKFGIFDWIVPRYYSSFLYCEQKRVEYLKLESAMQRQKCFWNINFKGNFVSFNLNLLISKCRTEELKCRFLLL